MIGVAGVLGGLGGDGVELAQEVIPEVGEGDGSDGGGGVGLGGVWVGVMATFPEFAVVEVGVPPVAEGALGDVEHG